MFPFFISSLSVITIFPLSFNFFSFFLSFSSTLSFFLFPLPLSNSSFYSPQFLDPPPSTLLPLSSSSSRSLSNTSRSLKCVRPAVPSQAYTRVCSRDISGYKVKRVNVKVKQATPASYLVYLSEFMDFLLSRFFPFSFAFFSFVVVMKFQYFSCLFFPFSAAMLFRYFMFFFSLIFSGVCIM